MLVKSHSLPAAITDTCEGWGEEVEVVHLLEGDHVRTVLEDLLQDSPSPAAPVKNARVAETEVVQLCSDC